MTSVIRNTSVAQDSGALRGFVRANAADEEYTAALLACIDRLEALATSTAKRSGIGSFVHIVKERDRKSVV